MTPRSVAGVVGPPSGQFGIARGGADHAGNSCHVGVASCANRDAVPLPLRAGGLLLFSGMAASGARCYRGASPNTSTFD